MNRIGLGCMGMARRNEESSIRTVDTALDHGVTMFNVGEFYKGGESEIVLGNALRQHPRDKYFVSVKFGALPSREALYGVDMNPFNVRAHLTYSLSRLGLDYVDLYEPARMDDAFMYVVSMKSRKSPLQPFMPCDISKPKTIVGLT